VESNDPTDSLTPIQIFSRSTYCTFASDPYFRPGNYANNLNPLFSMHTAKHLQLLDTIGSESSILDYAERVTLERKYPPFYRTYIAFHTGPDKELVSSLDEIAVSLALDCNVFRTGGKVTSITFVDADEHRQSR